MLTTLTLEQVRALAPDAAAARAGEALAGGKAWSAVGRSEAGAWGLCEGSGQLPYQVAIDLAGPAYRCSCPSRKIPCKHTLGLLFIVARGAAPTGSAPDWASSWLEGRATKAAAAAAKVERGEPAEADPAARVRRIESREKKVAAGLADLARWIADLVRRGLDTAHAEGYRFWDAEAGRLVDAQASGLARRVRALGSLASSGDAWPSLLLEGTARLHLVCEAYGRLVELPEPLRADVRSIVGWTVHEDELDAAAELADRWLVVGRTVEESGQVTTARTWLLGELSNRFALHLAFGVPAAPPTVIAVPGQAFTATLAFYRSATPLRAALRPSMAAAGSVAGLPAGGTIAAMLDGHARRLAANPFLDAWPVQLECVVPVVSGDGRVDLMVRELDGAAVPVSPASVAPRLLAISGGRPITLLGEWDGVALRPLSAFADGRLVDLALPERPSVPVSDAASSWPLLVSAALLGTERAPALPPVGDGLDALMAGNRERALLSAAAVVATRMRAGRRAGRDDRPPPEPADPDPRPPLAGELAGLLRLLLAEHRSLLEEFLGLTERYGRRLPDETLPDLAALRTNREMGEAIGRLGGPRLRWLAARLPEFEARAEPRLESTSWEEATPSHKAAMVRTGRAADPGGTREMLATRLAALSSDERAECVAALEIGLSPADETLLDGLLHDRRMEVRSAAADLLARLETSAFARSIAARARPLLATKGRLRPTLAVTLPETDDKDQLRPIVGKAPQGTGERAWILRALVAFTPPERWAEWLKSDAGTIVGLAAGADEAGPLLDGFVGAVRRFGDLGWARAMLGERRAIEDAPERIARILEGVAPSERAGLVAEIADRLDAALLAGAVLRCPPPWPPRLAEAAFAALRQSGDERYPASGFYELARRCAACLPPPMADRLAEAASHEGEIRPALAGVLGEMRLRARIHEAFAELTPVRT